MTVLSEKRKELSQTIASLIGRASLISVIRGSCKAASISQNSLGKRFGIGLERIGGYRRQLSPDDAQERR
jgi:hypothetical protein